ncbi:MAG: LuxR family transcriptional regulator [Zetaproteobacteria bacterium]|nr:MAG: LuxR family transcriptional regulator [Zetaproteobacteria bacterium]
MWIDSHCHLNHSGITEKGSPSDIINAAKQAGIDGMVSVCCRMSEEIETLLDIANAHDNVWCSIGTHPHDAGLEAEKAYSQDDIVKIATTHDKVIALGETGLDYFYDNSPRDDQQQSFRKHIRACITSGLPMIVHTRDAEDDTARIMKEEGAGTSLSGVMHCFSSTQTLAEQSLELGFYISFSGIITFKKAQALRDTAKIVPLDRVLVETDAPFLAPVPFRGKVNEPAFVANTGAFLAEIYGKTPEEFAKITTENFFRLFTKAKLV